MLQLVVHRSPRGGLELADNSKIQERERERDGKQPIEILGSVIQSSV